MRRAGWLGWQCQPLNIVRAVDGMDGSLAWQRLIKRYNPRTLARALAAMEQAVSPVKVTEIAKLEAAVMK